MRKEITEFIANCNENTPIDKLKDICESEEELNEALLVYGRRVCVAPGRLAGVRAL